MTTIRSPKGLSLVIVATMTVIVCGLGLLSSLDVSTQYTTELSEQARWLRGPWVAAAAVVIGVLAWVMLALLSYGFALGIKGQTAAFAGMLLLAGKGYLETWPIPSPFGNPIPYEAASLVGPASADVYGTWRGVVHEACGYTTLSELTIHPNGDVQMRKWGAYDLRLFPALHTLRVIPSSPPFATRNGTLLNGEIRFSSYQLEGGMTEPSDDTVYRIRRDGARLNVEWVPET